MHNPTTEEQIAALTAAGWERIQPGLWRAPKDGNKRRFYTGPLRAYLEMQKRRSASVERRTLAALEQILVDPAPGGAVSATTDSHRKKVYVASKSAHGLMWQRFRLEAAAYGITVNATWIFEYKEGDTSNFADLWTRCVREASEADALIAYYAIGEVWKGAFIEIGAALASGKPVYVVGYPPGSWVEHPLVKTVCTLSGALAQIAAPAPKPADGASAEKGGGA